MRISIIVTIFNKQKYLRKCVDSILNQSYNDIEVILVDDGSADESGRICDEYKFADHRVRVIHKKNEGLGPARVAGIRHSEGDYIGFVDADDWIEKDTIKSLVDCSARFSYPDIVIGGYVIDNEGEIEYPLEKGEEHFANRDDAMLSVFYSKYYSWTVWDKLYKRKLLENEEILNNWKKDYGEDLYACWNIFSKADKVCYHPVWGYHYFVHDESMMRTGSFKKYYRHIDIWQELFIKAHDTNRHKLALAILEHMVNEGVLYLELIYREDNSEINNISSYAEKIKKCCNISGYECGNDKEKQTLQHKYRLVKMYAYDNGKYRDDELVKFCNNNRKNYLYGNGGIANEIEGVLNRIGLKTAGRVVTNVSAGNSSGRVHSLNSIMSNPDDVGLILAMNRENTEEVISLLGGYDPVPVFNAGDYSFSY